jgi:hypothetical protein
MQLSWSTSRRIMTLIATEAVLSTPGTLPRTHAMLDEATSDVPPSDAHRRCVSVEAAADAGLLLAAKYETVLPVGSSKMLLLQTLTDTGRDPEVSTGDRESCATIV